MTANLGFDKPLYILSFDHRGLVAAKSGSEGTLSDEQTAEVASAKSQLTSAKHLVYSGFKEAVAAGVPKDKAGILVDEQCGAAILGSAAEAGYLTACPAEKIGQDEFDFEFGEDFAKHIEPFHPTFCKVKVRYNPQGDRDLNRRQSARLKRLSDYLHYENRTRFMFELALPPRERPQLTIEAIQQLQDAQVEPDVWRIEGLDLRDDYEKIAVAARRGGRDKVGCIVTGSGGKDPNRVREQLKLAVGVPGFVGFAMGRTIFSEPLGNWATREITSRGAATQIARRYREFVNIFENGVASQVT